MKTNKFTGYCSLYNINYYDTFIVMPHAFDSSDTKIVPIFKTFSVYDPNCVVGYAILSTKNDIGVMAKCFLNEDIEISNVILDGWINNILYGEDFNIAPKQVISGNIKAIVLCRKEDCRYHECVTAIEEE